MLGIDAIGVRKVELVADRSNASAEYQLLDGSGGIVEFWKVACGSQRTCD